MIPTIAISPPEREAGLLSEGTIKDAQRAFRTEGVLILKDIVDVSLIAKAKRAFDKDLDAYLSGAKGDCLWPVSKDRFLITVDLDPPFDDPALFANPWLVQILAALLGKDFVIDAFGVVCSLPGAPAQNRHHDGGVLFAESGLDRILPAVAITVGIPLLEMNLTNGTTSVWPGKFIGDTVSDDLKPEAPVISEGSCMLWDFRVHHRGTPNQSSTPRPLLYLTYCRPWWFDHLNFSDQTRKPLRARKQFVESLPKDLQRLLVRAENY